jgi:hypothetical protein
MDFKAGLYDVSGDAISGSTDLVIKIKRDADDYFYDFDDSTFKASGWISISSQLSEPDATNMPGEYEVSVDISGWNDGVYTAYIQYSGSPAWTDTVEFRVYDGKESVALVEELGSQAKADVNAEADTALSDYDPPTRAESTSDKDAVISEIDANESKIDAIQADTNELQGLISDSKIAAQVKGMDDSVINASALGTDAANKIRDCMMDAAVDGFVDVQECLKIVLAVLGGDMTKENDTYAYKDQSGIPKVTEVVGASTVERTIS